MSAPFTVFPSPLRGGLRGGGGSGFSAALDAALRPTAHAALDHPHPPHKGEGVGRRRVLNSPLMTFPTSFGKTASLTQGEAE